MEDKKDEAPVIINETINENPILIEKIEEVLPVKVKKPRSEKQQEALKKMLQKRKEMAVVQRAERKERRTPLWHRELNSQQKEILELKNVIEMLKHQVITDPPKEEVVNRTIEEESEKPYNPFRDGDDIYYHPPPVVRQPILNEPKPVRIFTPNDKLSLLRHVL
jgi:hypothetical protein